MKRTADPNTWTKLKWSLTTNTNKETVYESTPAGYRLVGKGREYGGGIRRDWTLYFHEKELTEVTRMTEGKGWAEQHYNREGGREALEFAASGTVSGEVSREPSEAFQLASHVVTITFEPTVPTKFELPVHIFGGSAKGALDESAWKKLPIEERRARMTPLLLRAVEVVVVIRDGQLDETRSYIQADTLTSSRILQDNGGRLFRSTWWPDSVKQFVDSHPKVREAADAALVA